MSAAKDEPDDTPAEGADGGEDSASATHTAGNWKKRIILIGAVATVLAAAGGGAGYYFMGEKSAPAEEPALVAEELVDVAPITVNLRSANGSTQLLKVHFMLVPGEMTKEEITARLPVVIDAYQPFLRELRPEDLAGSAAIFRLKEEMLVRTNAAMGPKAVRDVLIQDLMQQ